MSRKLRWSRWLRWAAGPLVIWSMMLMTPGSAEATTAWATTPAITPAILATASKLPSKTASITNSAITSTTTAIQTNSSSRSVSSRSELPRSDLSRSEMSPDIQRILRRGKLIVAMLKQDNPPFFATDAAGELEGLDAQVARSLADQLGVEVEFNRSANTFDQVVKTVYQLDADLAISKLSRTLNRAKLVRFTQPYVTMRQGLLVNRLQIAQQANGRNIAEVIRNLEGKVGVIQGSSYVGFLQKKFPKAEIVEFPSWSAAIDAVIRGDVLATYRDELEVKKIVLSKPDAALQFQTIALTDTEDSIAIALPWDSQHLLAFVNQSLEMMQINHTADSLLQDYTNAEGKIR